MSRAFQNRESGVSLIELMIAITLLALIQAGASAFFKRVMTSDVEAAAKANTISEITLFLSTIERDLKLRDFVDSTSGLCPNSPSSSASTCKSFTVTRIARDSSGGEVRLPVTFETTCVTPSASAVVTFLQKHELKVDSSASETGATNGRCLNLYKCGAGTYPQLTIKPDFSAAGPGVRPNYPRYSEIDKIARFPNLDPKQGIVKGTIGAALCGYTSASSKTDRLVLEAAYVNSEGQVRVEKREVSVPRRNIANIQMLPNASP